MILFQTICTKSNQMVCIHSAIRILWPVHLMYNVKFVEYLGILLKLIIILLRNLTSVLNLCVSLSSI